MILETVVSASTSAWVDSGLSVSEGDEVHIAASRVAMFGNSGSTVWGVAMDVPSDPGGISLAYANVSAYPEGSYQDATIGRALNPSACTNSPMGGSGARLAADVRPFCLAAKISTVQPGWNAAGCVCVERAVSFVAGSSGKLWLAFNDYQGCFANSSFYWVLVGKPDSGKTMRSGHSHPNGQWVSSGLTFSEQAQIAAKATGLCRTPDGLWWFAEGGYGSSLNTNPPHDPGSALSSYNGWTNYPCGNLRPFCFGVKSSPSLPSMNEPACLEVGRGASLTVPAGSLWLAWNGGVQSGDPAHGGWIVWIIEGEEQLPPPVVSSSREQHVQFNRFVRVY